MSVRSAVQRARCAAGSRAVHGTAIVVALALSLTAASALAAAPLRWASKAFSADSDAVEVLTLRGVDAKQRPVFFRISLANAAHRDGELEVSLRLTGPKGPIRFFHRVAKDQVSIGRQHLEIVGGGVQVSAEGDVLSIDLQTKTLIAKGTATLQGGLVVRSQHSDGVVERELVAPFSKLQLSVATAKGEEITVDGRAVITRDASNVAAHRVFDHSAQLHHVSTSSAVVVDFVRLPADRGGKLLGFASAHGGGQRFAAPVIASRHVEQRVDAGTGYSVPWILEIDAAQGGRTLTVVARATKQVKRTDELAKMPFLVRKAVGMVFKPYSYTLDAAFEVKGSAGVALVGKGTLHYSQVR